MNAIAPTKVKVVSGKKKSPWRNATLVKMEKRECRKAERRWRKTNLQVHFDIYKERLYIFNLEFKKSRQSFSDIITKNKNNARALFATVDRLTNPPVPVASEQLSTRACNEFASFFIAKIQNIRQAVSAIVSGMGGVIIEKAVFQPLNNYLIINGCFDVFQSGF